MTSSPPELRIILERLVYLRRIKEAVLGAFGPSENYRDRLRNSIVVRHVAAALDREPSAALGADVIQAMRAHGWRTVRHSAVWWWKGMAKR